MICNRSVNFRISFSISLKITAFSVVYESCVHSKNTAQTETRENLKGLCQPNSVDEVTHPNLSAIVFFTINMNLVWHCNDEISR